MSLPGSGNTNPGLPEFAASPSDPGFAQDPYPTYQQMRELGPAIWWQDYGEITFTRHREVDAILRDRRFGREITHVMSREEAGLKPIPARLTRFYAFEANSMLEREPPVHTRLRGLVNRAFVSRNIAGLAPGIEALANSLIDAFPDDERFDLIRTFCEPVPVLVIADLLGVPCSMADQLLAWSHAMVAMYQFNRDRATEDAAICAMDAFSAHVRDLAHERRRSPRDDVISALVEARDKGDRLSEDELVTTVILLLNAGHEATVHALGNGVKAILQSCIPRATLFASPEATERTVEELLRFDTPLHRFTRYALEDIEFAGVPINRGQQIGLLLGSANHDEHRYPYPQRLDPGRGGEGHVSFGAGVHFCVGAPLARLEMAVCLPLLFRRLPDLAIARQPVYTDRYHFRGLSALEVTAGRMV